MFWYKDIWSDESTICVSNSAAFSVIHTLLVHDGNACQCPTAVGLKRNHLAHTHF